MKLWAEKRERESKFGYGCEAEYHHAINPVAKQCEFEKVSREIFERKLGPVERVAINAYIKELKEREANAVTSARIYRDKMEKCQLQQKRKAAEGLFRQQEIREYYRNSIQEGRTRAGLMIRKAKNGDGK